MKKCGRCREQKDKNNFSSDKSRKDGLYPVCNLCLKLYREKNKKRINQTNEKYRKTNQDKIYAYRVKNKENKAVYTKQYHKDRKIIDPMFRFAHNVRSLVGKAFKRKKTTKYKKNTKTELLLGCTIAQLHEHLAKHFLPGMSLDNHGEWHIDHRIPLASASTQAEIEALCHYTNLQPLWAEDNLKKGDKL